jgi:hypothetical protein
MLSIASKGSLASIASVGSAFSIGSVGSAGSAFSVGSAGSAGSVLSAGARSSAMSAGMSRGVLGYPAREPVPLLVAAILVVIAAVIAYSPAKRRISSRS